jgi:V/A-type H+-transporting ATPase subunit K
MKQKTREAMAPFLADGRFHQLHHPATPLMIVKTVLVIAVLLVCSTAMAADNPQTIAGDQSSTYRTIGLGLAAALAVGASIIGAGYAVGRIGSAALGAISEKPELLPRAILFVALGEGLAILGFAFAMLLLQKM